MGTCTGHDLQFLGFAESGRSGSANQISHHVHPYPIFIHILFFDSAFLVDFWLGKWGNKVGWCLRPATSVFTSRDIYALLILVLMHCWGPLDRRKCHQRNRQNWPIFIYLPRLTQNWPPCFLNSNSWWSKIVVRPIFVLISWFILVLPSRKLPWGILCQW